METTLLRLGRAALPILALLALALSVAGVLAFAGDTLGYDFRAYRAAAVRVLEGGPLYDMSFDAAGGFGLFYYPPMFAPLILPFGLLPESTAIWVWAGVLVACFLVGVAILPVSSAIRWWVVLLAGVGLLFAYSVKLGQVGPILFLLFAAGWRLLGTQAWVGVAAALGTAVKLQPAVLFVWALLTRRWVTIGIGLGVLAVLSIAATLIAGIRAWSDFLTLVGRVADPIVTPNNASPGAAVYQLGATIAVATLVQIIAMAFVIVVVIAAARLIDAEASYLVAAVASQVLSPVLWDHYAVLLLLPVAYLCSSGRWWALLLPVLTSAPFVLGWPRVVYPLAFLVALVGVLMVGLRSTNRRVIA